MELFYSRDIAFGKTVLDPRESAHCVRVLRHRSGDEIHVIDGCGRLYTCRIAEASPEVLSFEILSCTEGYGSHPYHLHMAVALPKNSDRFEWFVEKATEIGVDAFTPLAGEYSERRSLKPERLERIIVSAAKQSHKGTIPLLQPLCSVTDFLEAEPSGRLRLIACCGDTEALGAVRLPLGRVLEQHASDLQVTVMIGPEGDFSRNEVAQAISLGWLPVSLGTSRLRLETAALVSVSAVYLHYA